MEAPHLNQLADQYKADDLVVVAVNSWDEPKDGITKFVEENQLEYLILLDGREVGRRYGLIGIPTLLWINRWGLVVDTELGFDGPEHLDQRTRRLLYGPG